MTHFTVPCCSGLGGERRGRQRACSTAEARGARGHHCSRGQRGGFHAPGLLSSAPTGFTCWANGQPKTSPTSQGRRPAVSRGGLLPPWHDATPRPWSLLGPPRSWESHTDAAPEQLRNQPEFCRVQPAQGHVLPKATHSLVFGFCLRCYRAVPFAMVSLAEAPRRDHVTS